MNEQTERKSIIGSKYAGKYKDKDWLGQFVDANATDAVTREKKLVDPETKAETVETIETGKRSLNLDKLFQLCKANGIDTAKMEAQRDRPNAPGRIRMTLGNRLRAAAKHRHGLYDLNGEWTDADPAFLGDSIQTHNRDGSKIQVNVAEASPSTEESAEG